MNTIKPLNLITDPNYKTKFEPGRPVWVLMHKDKSHFHCLPDGNIDWSYNKADMELRERILIKDFGNTNYGVVELSWALPLFCNHQAELVTLWTPAINNIRKARSLKERFGIYQNFIKRHKQPHPLEADALLKRLLDLK